MDLSSEERTDSTDDFPFVAIYGLCAALCGCFGISWFILFFLKGRKDLVLRIGVIFWTALAAFCIGIVVGLQLQKRRANPSTDKHTTD